MAIHAATETPRVHRTAIAAGLLVALSILLVTQDANGAIPYVLLALVFSIGVHGYFRSRPRRPWECNDEPQ
jgi:hypothetical protein